MKTFCPSCEKETNCVYIAELYECKECGCDFESKQRQMQERLDAAIARAEAAEARVPELQAALDAAINMNIEKNAEIINLTAALAAANEDAERLSDKLSEVVAYGGYYADIENRMPPDGQTFKVIAVSPSDVDDFTVLRMDGKLYFASDPPREVPNGFEIIRIKPWDVKTFGKTEEEDF